MARNADIKLKLLNLYLDDDLDDFKLFADFISDKRVVQKRVQEDKIIVYSGGQSLIKCSQPWSVTSNSSPTNKIIAGGLVHFSSLTEPARNELLTVLPDSMKTLSPQSARAVAGTIVTVQLGWAAISNIYNWWNGKISGDECAANLITELGSFFTGTTGAIGGATIGSFLGPVGAIAGGVIGGIVGSVAGTELFQSKTRELFDLPKSAAAVRSYEFLGVHSKSSDVEVRRAFLRLSLIYHPDKGGSTVDFIYLQECMTIIKADRGDFTN